MPPFPKTPRCLSPFQMNLVSLHCLHFHTKDRLPPRWYVGQPCGKASWESLVGKPRVKATDPMIDATGSVTLHLQLWRKAHVHAPIRDEDLLPCGDSRRTPRSMCGEPGVLFWRMGGWKARTPRRGSEVARGAVGRALREHLGLGDAAHSVGSWPSEEDILAREQEGPPWMGLGRDPPPSELEQRWQLNQGN